MMLAEDLRYKNVCYFGGYRRRAWLHILLSDGTSAMVLYRLARSFSAMKLGIIGWVFLEINKLINGCVIGRNADFGKGFVIMHPQGVVINSGVKGGERVVIESGVVIGAARNGLPVRVPVLGNDVFVGAGAKILGGIKVGNHVKIGANAVVVHDVPDGATAVGIPAQVIRTGKSDV